MASTTEEEWVKIIIENWNVFGKTRITKEDIYNNPTLIGFCNDEDYRNSASRKNEQVYRQQIGNIVSHRNKNFNFLKIESRIYFWPKNFTNEMLPENNLGKVIESGKTNEEILKAVEEYESKSKLPNIKERIQKSYYSSATLKNALKVIHQYSCEFNCDMEDHSFKIKNDNYVEVHHVIPIKNQTNFKQNLDTSKNLIVLCPRHHRMFHFGSDDERKKLFLMLPKRNKVFLSDNNITLNNIWKLY